MRRKMIALAVALLLLAAGAAEAASNVLTWQDHATTETLFHIERKAEPCLGPGLVPFLQIGTVGANVTTYTDVTVQEGITYCYRVAASNATGKSAYSNTAQRIPPFSVPGAPSNLAITGGL